MKATLASFVVLLLGAATLPAADSNSPLVFESIPAAKFKFTGPVGERVQANMENWLLRAPQSNPGMIEMFRVRDRKPVPQLVPWAGEFVGKYLISAVQALRMSDDPRLRQQVSNVVSAFIATQAEDGYLGPFPKQDRLLKNWDLWGHYHAILALTMWHEHSGDTAALSTARKAADLVCATYLDTGRRVFDAGDHEMNMSILTAMALLHRLTGEPRYLRMAREVEKDWERAGDYLRSGLDGREFFRSPKPRWESLHDLQGLLEMYRITGEAKYRDAFVHHWRSIRRWDRRNTGGFSSGEQATGNPYAPTAIETCCTVAWMSLTIDYLRLTGDSLAADDLELATLNGGLGAQHPSGRWWTYNTPMDGVREASAHSIVFQARAGTPELNCCSVNAPRVLGMLSEWAVMDGNDGVVVNSYLPGTFTLPQADKKRIITLDHDFPRIDTQRVVIIQSGGDEWTLHLRIPTWSKRTRVGANFPGVFTDAPAGSYVKIRRRWQVCDEVVLRFDMELRAVPGANEAAGKVSVYRGPLLLAYDQAQNDFDEDALPALDLGRLTETRLAESASSFSTMSPHLRPWLKVEAPTTEGLWLRLVDFASAGATGTRYRSWLPVQSPPPPPALTQLPPDAGRVPAGPVLFQWRGPRSRDVSYRVEFSTSTAFAKAHVWSTNLAATRVTLNTKALAALTKSSPSPIYWRVVSRNANGETVADVPPAWFIIDPSAPPQVLPVEPKLGPNKEMIVHSLRGGDAPQFGELKSAKFSSRDESGTEVNGRDQMLAYSVPAWPEEDFTVSVRVNIKEHPQKRIGQIFSAWAGGMDDPLRLVVDGGRLFARIEAGGGFSTPGATVETGRWYAVAAIKRGGTLTLFVNGRAVGSCPAPEFTDTQAQDCALGGNPHFSGNEFLAARFADFRFYARSLSSEEVQAWSAAH
ncbi:MAG: glycoside hydrolase family 127 protein [Verrucomicrobia bacterium]|nr:glycoside hydrolase family 127 protein [Verrucomicrobiota bacterium]